MADLLYAAFLGLIAGFVPVYLGLMPLWAFKRLSSAWRAVLLSFSVGILLFLFVDVTHEGVELAEAPGSSPSLLALGLVVGLLGPVLVAGRRGRVGTAAPGTARPTPWKFMGTPRLFTAFTIALGIGLHNLGEGLAIGASYAAGTIGLTTLLVIGFFIHNSTEGLGVSAPIAAEPTGRGEFLLLGFVAGFPTIIGSMIGSLSDSGALGTLFFAAAAGALLYVIVELVKASYAPDRMRSGFVSILAGILFMYFTGLLVP
ncbi:MAG TPA: ZIP family metal transporter [Thermoplasmata archaeon]